MMRTVYLLLRAIKLLLSFKKEESGVSPAELLDKMDVESGTITETWWNYGTGDDFTADWTDETSFSSSHSLKVSRTTFDPINFWYWGKEYIGYIPKGKTLKLAAKIKGKDLLGPGVSIAIGCDSQEGSIQFATTEHKSLIRGTFDWATYRIDLINVDPKVTKIYVFLVYLQNTIGTAYFDEISLTYE